MVRRARTEAVRATAEAFPGGPPTMRFVRINGLD
jgi:hypothetical protein